MAATQQDILQLFRESGALLNGHFQLRSGLRSGHFFQCARVCEDMAAVTQLAQWLLPKLEHLEFTTVLAPAMGGLVIGQEVARQTGSRYLFAEKDAAGALVLRRNFSLSPGERVLVVEDVVTRGGRAQEAVQIVREHGGEPVAVAVLVDRSEGKANFAPLGLISLLELSFPTYPADQLPPELACLPVTKPGS
jgi:orotate phosphoribosyltransferase